jgi:hypothetical protein
MIPVGSLYKRIVAAAPAVTATNVVDVYSVSGCVNDDFADYIDFWRHNGYRLFDSPAIMQAVAAEHAISLDGLTLFYYEAYEREWVDDRHWKKAGVDSREAVPHWTSFTLEPSFSMNVVRPAHCELEGFDVVTFSAGNAPEHSPLSCNALADDLPVNTHCLFATFDEAFKALEQWRFTNSEPGPYRILTVYTVPETAPR